MGNAAVFEKPAGLRSAKAGEVLFLLLAVVFFAGSFIFLLLGFAFKGTFAGSKCSVLFWWYSCVTQL